ncbi:MAG: alpha-amylase family glycosyl hydrolase [Kineosporiaceae bacterium]
MTVYARPDAAPASAEDPARRRRRLLGQLYGRREAAELDRRLAALLARAAAPRRGTERPRLDQRDAWLIAYPDHVREPGRSPLAALADLVRDHLAPEITGVHTLPLHPASGDGGFAVRDFSRVDPRHGEESDVRRLAAATDWTADAVVNHVSAGSDWLRRHLAGDPGYEGFFRSLDPATDVSAVVRPRTTPLAHRFVRADGVAVDLWTTFSGDQVDLDYRTPDVLVAVVEVLLRYVALGARAIRLDAVAFLWKDPAGPSVHLPQTHWLVQLFRACLDSVDPGVLLVTETNVPHHENVTYLGLAGEREAQAVYQFPLPPLVLHSLASGSAATLADWARRCAFPEGERTYLNFLASHDGIGLRAVEGLLPPAEADRLAALAEAAGGAVNHRSAPGGPRPYELAVTWFDAVGHGHHEDAAVARHLASHAVALALRGVPLLYLGSVLAASNDVAAHRRSGHARDLNRRRFTTAEITAALADPGSRARRVRDGLRAMLRVRRGLAAFSPWSAQVVHEAPDELLLVERIPERGPRALVAVNVSDHPVPLDLPRGAWTPVSAHHRPGSLPPWRSAWFVEDPGTAGTVPASTHRGAGPPQEGPP